MHHTKQQLTVCMQIMKLPPLLLLHLILRGQRGRDAEIAQKDADEEMCTPSIV